MAGFGGTVGIHSREHVSRLVSGKADPSDTLIIAICCVHRVRREWLEQGEEPMFQPLAGAPADFIAEHERRMEAMERRLQDAERQRDDYSSQLAALKLKAIGRELRDPPERGLVAEKPKPPFRENER